jgi:hypothetical protein
LRWGRRSISTGKTALLERENVKDVKFHQTWYSLHAEVLKVMEIFRYTSKHYRNGRGTTRVKKLGSSRFLQTWSKHKMDVIKMLADLRQERDQLEEAIMTLERLARGRGRRRGRPPAWMTELKRRGRPPGSKNKAKESNAA